MERDVELIRRRMLASGLVAPRAVSVHDAARRLACSQGQDLKGVITSLALRVPGGTAAQVTEAMTQGNIVRGYPMRTTVFALAADDLPWMGELLRASFIRELERRRTALGTTAAEIHRAGEIALAEISARPDRGDGAGILRTELAERWREAGLDANGPKVYHLLVNLMIEGTLAYGPWDAAAGEQRVIAQHSWLPSGNDIADRFGGERHAAIVEWLRRYLISHGPATLRDFAWWTKLGLTEIRRAAPEATDGLVALEIEGDKAWADPRVMEASAGELEACEHSMLLPGFDELVLGYKDRGYLLTPEEHAAVVPGNNGIFRNLAIDRCAPIATWKRLRRARGDRLELTPLHPEEPLKESVVEGFERVFSAYPTLVS